MVSKVNIIAELHNNDAGPTYAASLIDSEKLDGSSVYMVELPLPINGVIQAFYRDEISEEELADFFKGYASENIGASGIPEAKAISQYKAAGISTYAYDARANYIGAENDLTANQVLLLTKENESNVTLNGYAGIVNGLNDLRSSKLENAGEAEADSKIVSANEIAQKMHISFFGEFPQTEKLSFSDSITIDDLSGLISSVEARQLDRLMAIDNTIEKLREYGDDFEFNQELSDLIISRQEEGLTSMDSLNAEVIVNISSLGEYTGQAVVLSGEGHVIGSLVNDRGEITAEGTLDDAIKNFGVDDVEIVSVRDSLEAFDAGNSKKYLPECTSKDTVKQFVIVDPDTGEQTIFSDMNELETAYNTEVGVASDRFANYCHDFDGPG